MKTTKMKKLESLLNKFNAEIVETRRQENGWQKFTGNHRLVGVPGDYIEIPGKGGRKTKLGALKALEAFDAGKTNGEAQSIAFA